MTTSTVEKVRILGEAGKWDTCASSASTRKVSGKDRIGNTASAGVCHSFTENGRCISLYKTLLTNSCGYDCKYCQNAYSCKTRKTIFEPKELAKVFMNLYTRNYVEGLFLSSGVYKDPDTTTEMMLESVNNLRNKHKFRGYVHFKIIPGTSRELVKQAGEIADRLSVNLEAPNKSRMSEISNVKDYKTDILRRQSWVKRMKLPSGQTTQLVVGGSDESDLEILKMSDWEYKNIELNRAYYSAFTPIKDTPLEKKDKTPFEREHRLYASDFMFRKYGIKLDELKNVMNDNDNLPKGDPKIHLARNYFDRPIDPLEASKQELIRIPGIGPQSMQRIMDLRNKGIKEIKKEHLKNIGVVMKRATPFLSINGHVQRTLGDF